MSHHYAIFSAQYLPHVGGVENFTANLAAQLVREGDQVTVVTSRLSAEQPEFETQANGVAVWRLPSRSLLNGRLPMLRKGAAFKKIRDALLAGTVDRVLVNTRFYALSLEGVRFAAEKGVPCVVLDHGSAYLTLGNAAADAAIRAYEHAVTDKLKSYGPTFAGISRKSCEWLETFGIETSLVIPNAIDAEAFRAESSGRDFRAELGAEDRMLVAFTGRLEPEKGAEELAQAAALLSDGYAVAMAGEGSLRARIVGLGIANVRLLGNISHADLSALLSQADVFCLPSRSEGFSTALLEAAAWGLPIVTTDVGGAAEVADAGAAVRIISAPITPQVLRESIIRVASGKRAGTACIGLSWTETTRLLREGYRTDFRRLS